MLDDINRRLLVNLLMSTNMADTILFTVCREGKFERANNNGRYVGYRYMYSGLLHRHLNPVLAWSDWEYSPPPLSPLQRPLLVNSSVENGSAGNDGKREKAGASLLSLPFPAFPARFTFPSTQPPRVFSQACSQGATVGGLCRGESLPVDRIITHLRLPPPDSPPVFCQLN